MIIRVFVRIYIGGFIVKNYETLELEVISVNTDVVLTVSNQADTPYVGYNPSYNFWGFLGDENE